MEKNKKQKMIWIDGVLNVSPELKKPVLASYLMPQTLGLFFFY